MRFIGNKRNLIDDIESFIRKNVDDKVFSQGVFLDLLGGTNSVAYNFKQYMPVITNDSMYFSYVLSRGATTLNRAPDFTELSELIGTNDILGYLNSIPEKDLIEGFITRNYTLSGSDRNYMSPVNAMRVDSIRVLIGSFQSNGVIDDDGYYYLLASLIEAVSHISNTRGSYSAFLAVPDNRTLEPLTLQHPVLIDNHYENQAYHSDAAVLAPDVEAAICYIDPPYSNQQYTSNYHLLETICLYDDPVIKGKTGIRDYKESEKSAFCSKVMAVQALFNLVEAAQSPHIIVSYTSRGILDLELIRQALAHSCDPQSISVERFSYHTHKGAIVKRDDGHCEYLVYAHKPQFDKVLSANLRQPPCVNYSVALSSDALVRSPIAHPYDQLCYVPEILKLLPSDINEFIDVFSGGMNVSLNAECTRVISNDLNGAVVDMIEHIANANIADTISSIQDIVNHYNLSRINSKGFLKLRADYNKKPTPLKLYVLICHSYDYSFRFNSKGAYNSSFGRGRTSFSEGMKRALIAFSVSVKGMDVEYHKENFDVFIDSLSPSHNALYYCHPPSLLLSKEGAYRMSHPAKWGLADQSILYEKLNAINDAGHRFLLSDVYAYKDVTDKTLLDFAGKYNQRFVPHKNEVIKQVFVSNY